MDDLTEETLRKICCTCLSIDRKLHQLCKLDDGINNLFYLLSSDSEAYKIMFSRDATLLFICWECDAIMRRQKKFREQVCVAQKQLSQIIDRQLLLKSSHSLSKLNYLHQNTCNVHFVHNDSVHSDNVDNFIDCGPDIKDVKCEPEADITLALKSANSLSKLNFSHQNSYNIDFVHNDNVDNFIDCGPDINDIKCEPEADITLAVNNESANDSSEEYNNEIIDDIKVYEHRIEIKPLIKKTKIKKENNKKGSLKRKVKVEAVDVKEEGYSKVKMTEEEMVERINIKKLEERYVKATSKCESCVEVFKDENELEEHNSRLHVQKPKLVQCDICLVYIKFWWLPEHRNDHYIKYQCQYCELVSYSPIEILTHLRVVHSIKDASASGMLKKLKRKAMLTNPVLTPKKQKEVRPETALGFKCNDCNKYFENRYLRYKHILKSHREGHKCVTCGKTFAFKNTLNKHQQVHADPPPRQPCPICGKSVRADRARFHARVHAERKPVECVSCDKRFVSRDSYEKHLKYSKSHAVRDVHKNKCTMCDKGFRTVRELNDHIDFNHMGKTQYQCPICHKALATRRCVTRHVNRAHHGIKENTGDKILCQTCGKAFRDKKCLFEHELIHSGEKPLSCDECGRAFRQRACLYTHKRRVHAPAHAHAHADT